MNTEKEVFDIIKYNIDVRTITSDAGTILFKKVTPIFEAFDIDKIDFDINKKIPNSCFLYDDYALFLQPNDVFYEICDIRIHPNKRRKGEGTKLVKEFFEQYKPQSVVLSAGIVSKKLYEELEGKNKQYEYIKNNICPFWESLGFVDVNHTTFLFENHIPMLYPKEKAEEVIKTSKEIQEKFNEEVNKLIFDLR